MIHLFLLASMAAGGQVADWVSTPVSKIKIPGREFFCRLTPESTQSVILFVRHDPEGSVVIVEDRREKLVEMRGVVSSAAVRTQGEVIDVKIVANSVEAQLSVVLHASRKDWADTQLMIDRSGKKESLICDEVPMHDRFLKMMDTPQPAARLEPTQ